MSGRARCPSHTRCPRMGPHPGDLEAAKAADRDGERAAAAVPQLVSSFRDPRAQISKETFMRLRHSYPPDEMATGNHLQCPDKKINDLKIP